MLMPAPPPPQQRRTSRPRPLPVAADPWTDAALQLDSMTVALKQVQWPVTAPMPLHVAGILRPQGDGAAAAGTFEVDGPLTDRDAKLDVKLDGLTLDALAKQKQIDTADWRSWNLSLHEAARELRRLGR